MPRPVDPAFEAVLLAGAGCAILLQLARPEVGYGVARHSDFVRNPLARLHGTLTYVYAVTAGTPDDRAVAARYVSRMHAPVHAEASGYAPAYDARDPDLQLWVAATLYDTGTRVYARTLGNPPEAVADDLYVRYAALGTELDLPPGAWPPDRAAFAAYWRDSVAALRVDETIRGQADALWRAEAAPRWVRALMPLNRFVTAGFLPPRVREMYGMTWNAARQRRFDRLWSIVAFVYPRLPVRLRTAPKRYYLRRLRALAGTPHDS
ncbi:hypothetical protein AS850_15140 [Frondihabitans sp. 762G35]|uniref:oxygenase MpaB family protein n=1 Tax=Frondihabitans sp. 762G35 TaxID=1446794 RepID=UPI000D1FE828|nr:oxygenase MpaB family protein [Frondihabitans sp. 762G35]ARC58420.1 hypothetical protein AS850_15140 [Frondihabitans sp. 762G35]